MASVPSVPPSTLSARRSVVTLWHDDFIMPLTHLQRPLYEVKANLFKGLAHPYRIRILELLAGAPEVSVAELQEDTELEPSHLSQHLAVLRRYRLVVSERRASHVYYRLQDPQTAELLAVARGLLLSMLKEDEGRLADARELPSLPPSAGASAS